MSKISANTYKKSSQRTDRNALLRSQQLQCVKQRPSNKMVKHSISFTHHSLRADEERETTCARRENEKKEKVRDKQTDSPLRGSVAFTLNPAIRHLQTI